MFVTMSLVDLLSGMMLKDWIAVYAALLSSATAAVQIRNARHDRPRLRIRVFRDRVERSGTTRQFAVVDIANRGRKSALIYPPELEIARSRGHKPGVRYHSPDAMEADHEWVPMDDYGSDPEPFELKELQREFYRYNLSDDALLLRVRVTDRVGDVRATRRRLRSFPIRCYFYCGLATRRVREQVARLLQRSAA